MKVLMLSTDRKILDEGSAVRARMLEYAESFGELHILLISKRELRIKNHELRINQKLFIHTISFWRALISNCARLNLAQLNPDVVTAEDPFEIGLIGWIIAKRLGVRLQLQIHTDFLSPYFSKFSLLNTVRVQIAKFLLPKADSIRVVSERIKQSLIRELRIKNYELRIRVLPIFVDVEKIKSAPIKVDLHRKYPQFDKIILMISRLTREKNIEMAIEAMPHVLRHYPKAGLVIVGEGPRRAKLVYRSSELGVTENIIFEEWTDDTASYYKTADLFLNTSWYEGYGMTLIEAAACGTPIVSTEVGIAREVGANIVGWNTYAIAATVVAVSENHKMANL